MQLWDQTVAQVGMKRRLAGFAPDLLMVFSAACAAHARDVMAVAIPPSKRPELIKASQLLSEFWSTYPSSLSKIDYFSSKAGALAPSEDEGSLPGQEKIRWAIVYSFYRTANTKFVENSFEVANYSYAAVLASIYDRDDSYPRNEDEEFALETKSDILKDVSQKQVAFLTVLESNNRVPRSYSELFEAANAPE